MRLLVGSVCRGRGEALADITHHGATARLNR